MMYAILAQGDDSGGTVAMITVLVQVILAIAIIAGLWKMFTKAGKPGWASIIPIYNAIVLLEIAGKPIWWIILMLIPCVNIIILILVNIDLAKAFGKGTGFGIGLTFLPGIFHMILGFGDAKYVGAKSS